MEVIRMTKTTVVLINFRCVDIASFTAQYLRADFTIGFFQARIFTTLQKDRVLRKPRAFKDSLLLKFQMEIFCYLIVSQFLLVKFLYVSIIEFLLHFNQNLMFLLIITLFFPLIFTNLFLFSAWFILLYHELLRN